MKPEARALRALMGICALPFACATPSEPLATSNSSASAWSSVDGAESSKVPPKASRKGDRWEHFDKLTSFRKATPRLRSLHFAGDRDAEVLTNDQASVYPDLGPERDVAPGAVLVEALYAQGADTAVAYLAMVKFRSDSGNEAWSYAVVKPSGEAEEQGLLPLCERCHTEAPHNHLYGRGQ